MRVLVIDIGNTAATLGLYHNGKVSRVVSIRGGIRKEPEACAQAVRAISEGSVEGAIIATVVPAVAPKWRRLIRRELGCAPRFVSAQSPLNFTIDYPSPERIGADRLADAAGGVARYGAPLIVVDFGTALNFEVITADRAYIGGVITPGLPLMTDYLHEKTALLPRVALGEGEPPAIGRSTEEAIRLGAQVGYRGIVRETVAHLRHLFGGAPGHIVATGGYARWVLQGSDIDIPIDPDLTLFGLGVIFELGGSD